MRKAIMQMIMSNTRRTRRRLTAPERLLDGAELTIGGSGAIVACGAARLDLHAAVAGVVGDDLFDAGMIYGLLAGWSTTRALSMGCVCGALSTHAVGGA